MLIVVKRIIIVREEEREKWGEMLNDGNIR